MAQVKLNSVNKIYANSLHAVRNFDLHVQDREFMVIVGPSGCGKTTTLRMIAGLEEISDGTITIGDRIVNDVRPRDRDIAMVFQNYALYPHMTVFQNMAFALKLQKTPKSRIKQAVEKTARMLDIENLLNKKPKILSGGQRQRVALGRAIVRKPALFLFDEPLSNLDPELRITTRGELKALHRRLQTTSIYVTHDQTEAMTLGNRICVMYDGVIQQVAAPMEVYNKPVNRFVAGFLGTPPMNFFGGRIKVANSKVCFEIGPETIELSGNTAEKARFYADKKMILGIRPEHLSTTPCQIGTNNILRANVRFVEPLGHRMEVYLQSVSGIRFIAAIATHIRIKPDDTAAIYLNTEKIYIFEPGPAGLNISPG